MEEGVGDMLSSKKSTLLDTKSDSKKLKRTILEFRGIFKKQSKSDFRDFLKIQFEMLIMCSKTKLNFMELPSKQSQFTVSVLKSLRKCKFVQVKI